MKLRRFDGAGVAGYSFWCEGCGERHALNTEGGPPGQNWSFNGDLERPVFGPSVHVRTGHYTPRFKPDEEGCWCTTNAAEIAAGREPYSHRCQVCHTFIGCNGAAPGQIIYLGDCTHHLAGQVIDLPDFPEEHGA